MAGCTNYGNHVPITPVKLHEFPGLTSSPGGLVASGFIFSTLDHRIYGEL